MGLEIMLLTPLWALISLNLMGIAILSEISFSYVVEKKTTIVRGWLVSQPFGYDSPPIFAIVVLGILLYPLVIPALAIYGILRLPRFIVRMGKAVNKVSKVAHIHKDLQTMKCNCPSCRW